MSVKLTEEEIKGLPKDFQKGLKDGTVIALEVPKATMSNRAFTVYAAIIVGAMMVPIWIPLNSIAFLGASLGALGWMSLYWYEGHVHARTKLRADVASATLDRVFQLLDNAEVKDGTNGDDTGLTTHGPSEEDAIN